LKRMLLILLFVCSVVSAAEARTVMVVLFPFREAEIAAKVDGTVREYKFRVGEQFKAGDTLLVLDDTQYRIEAERAAALAEDAKVQAQFAEESYVAQKKLFDEEFQSKLELKRRETEVATANARKKVADANLAESRLQLSYCTLKVPFDGKIEAILSREHETIRAGQPLFRVIDDSKLLAVMNVPVSKMPEVGEKMWFGFSDNRIQVEGTVFEVSPRADHRSGTVEVKALIANSDGKLSAGLTGVLIDGK